MIYNKINITPTALPLLNILNDIANTEYNGLDLSTDYQKSYIWDQKEKEKLIFSLVLNYPIGNIIINQLEKPNKINAMTEIVDGRQRLTTIKDFCNNNLEIKGKIKRKIIETIAIILNNSQKQNNIDIMEKLKNSKSFKFKDLPKSIQNNITNYALPVYTMRMVKKEQIKEHFEFLQNQNKSRISKIVKGEK